VLEAVVGAIYLDIGFHKTQQVLVGNFLKPYYKSADLSIVQKDYKSLFFQYILVLCQQLINFVIM
jgi:dsRNA-specific ribonuclease